MKRKILIIDDTREIHNSLRMALEYEKYEVLSAMNGQLALNVLDTLTDDQLPDVILLDLMMPVMNGHQFLEELGNPARERFSRIPIIIMSAKHDEVFAGKFVPAATIKKPMGLNEVFETIELLLKPI